METTILCGDNPDLSEEVLWSIFTLTTSDLNLFKCQMCHKTYSQPIQLSCNHTFCMNCIQNRLKTSTNYSIGTLHQTDISSIVCTICFKSHKMQSVDYLQENTLLKRLINIHCCDQCHQIKEFKQLDTCIQCYSVLCPQCYKIHHRPDFHTPTPKIYTPITNHPLMFLDIVKFDMLPSDSDNTLKKPSSTTIINGEKKILSKKHFDRSFDHVVKNDLSSTLSLPDLIKHDRRALRSYKIEYTPILNEFQQPQQYSPTTPVTKFINLNDHYRSTYKHIVHCKQRIQELMLCTETLIEFYKQKILKIETNVNLYWDLLKQSILEHRKSTSIKELCKYLICYGCEKRQNISFSSLHDTKDLLRIYLSKNHALESCYQSSVMLLNQIDAPLNTISQLFECEERRTFKIIHKQLSTTLTNYYQIALNIEEKIKSYNEQFISWKNTNIQELQQIKQQWTSIVDISYPELFEKMSLDFIRIKTQDDILLSMLENVKYRTQQQILQRERTLTNYAE